MILLQVRVPTGGWLSLLTWPGDESSASTVLQVVATSVVTAMTLSFSLVVIALQLASQQFSPRLLREFARDWIIQGVVSVLFATFVFSLTTMRGFNEDTPMPRLSVTVAFAMGLASMAALLALLGHIIRALRVDTMMVAVHARTCVTINKFYAPYGQAPPRPPEDLPGAEGGQLISASRSGFVLTVDTDRLVRAAEHAGGYIDVAVRPGDHVTQGTPLGTWWRTTGEAQEDPVAGVRRAITLGYERTRDQDAALGFRQLSDIAVKALSPGINDPGTAAHAVGYLADLLVRLCGRSLGPALYHDDRDTPRVAIPDRDLRYYLDQSCGLVRRFARREPVVLVALLSMLRDVAVAARDDEQRAEVERQVDLVLDEMSSDVIADDEAAVRDLADRVRLVAHGEVAAAFADRSGETRSM